MKIQQAQTERHQAQKEIQNTLTRQFYSIFHGKNPIPVEKIGTIFNTYLANGCSLSVEKPMEGKCYAKINSMKPITKYLEDHPEIKACDFRSFKTEVHDIPTLAEYLKKSTVQAIALNKGISAEAQIRLAEVAVIRNGFKVQYFG